LGRRLTNKLNIIRSAADVSTKEYGEFCKSLTKEQVAELNKTKPGQIRGADDVSIEEYGELYRSFTKEEITELSKTKSGWTRNTGKKKCCSIVLLNI
jgi:hypothetical protein